MTWRGTLSSMQAAARRAEREAQRRQRELQKEQAQLERMQELERASYEVAAYENRVELLLSAHKECGERWDWEGLAAQAPPIEPSLSHDKEERARAGLENYNPGLLDKAFRRVEAKQRQLAEEVEGAIRRDEAEYHQALDTFREAQADWEDTRNLALRILSGDPSAYLEAIEEANPFADITSLGSSFDFQAEDQLIIRTAFHVNSDEVIPSEIKSLLRSGKLSVKQMPKGQFNELYEDYVSSCILRVAREVFALLPVEFVVATAFGTLLNTRTGQLEDQPIVSTAIPRKTLEKLNMDSVDPSDSMGNFIHRMNFNKRKGFSAVTPIDASELAS